MNYWILTTEFPPFHGGGISTYCYHTVKMLEMDGHQVTVIVSDHSLERKSVRAKEGATTIIRFHPGNKEYNAYLGYTAALSFEFMEVAIEEVEYAGAPDFIEVQDYQGIGYYLLNDKKLNANSFFKEIPVIVIAHSPSYLVLDHDQAPIYKLPEYWTGEMEKWCLTAADILIFPTNYAANALLPNLNRDAANTHVLFHPFHLEDQDNADSVPPNNNIKSIVYLGKLTYIKGILQLITYFSYLWDEGFELPLSLIGDDHYYGPRQSSMKEYLTKKFKKHVEAGKLIFEGKLPPNKVKSRLKEADIVIISSLFETFSYACAEAMASCKIVLASNSGGQSELIKNKVSGYLYEQGNYESFKGALLGALSLNDKEYENIVHNAQNFVKEFLNLEKINKQKIEILSAYKEKRARTFPFTQSIDKTVDTSDKPFVKDLLTIVIPYYNTGKYLFETIENLSKVDYHSYEIIVVNDGSDDLDSINALYSLQKKYKFEIVSQTNKGLATARNLGANCARGEFLAYLDADDKVAPNYYSKAIEIFKRYDNISYAGCWTQYFDGLNAIWPTYTPEPPYVLIHNTLNTSSLIFKRNDYLAAGMNDPAFMYTLEDQECIINMLSKGYRGVAIPEVLFFYRISPTSMSAQFNKVNLLHGYRSLSSKHKELYSRYAVDIYNFLNTNGPSYLYDNPTWEPQTDVRKLWDDINILKREIEVLRHPTTSLSKNSSEDLQLEYENWLAKANSSGSDVQIEVIKSWYHKEYEVLPLWYKRVGHVIKIMQGHKSFKSILRSKELK